MGFLNVKIPFLYLIATSIVCIAMVSCSLDDDNCQDCIYKGEDKSFAFDASHIDISNNDTTFYSIVLKTGNSFFLFQKKLSYDVLRYKSAEKKEWNFKSESITGF
ncbi:hypothetical protein G3O08_11830 [Cryomorpha ignava]|uniref:Lipoprotein n=1 Tax=Cryomorpha ignava TaxID=101383 RepID=A0A7K3WTI1_9FLAO|nr:hypothetical protein [Cryomorpha ignava]NEN24192.1 hypothetical protein [Cryomorpha ignava]